MAKRDGSEEQEFRNNLGLLTSVRLSTLDEAAQTQQMIHSLLQNEAQRLEGKLGSEHPRTQRLKAGLQANAAVARAVALERDLMRIEIPEAGEQAALVHGLVVDQDDLGIDRLAVCLVDQSDAPVRNAPEAMTDASGYFAIPLEPEIVNLILERYRDGVFLAVFTPRRRLLYRQPKPLEVAHQARLQVNLRPDRASLTNVPAPEPAPVVVPELVGLPEREALAVLKRAGLTRGERTTIVAPEQAGRVLEQNPTAGARVPPRSAVSLVVAVESTQTVPVPELVGFTLRDARAKLKEAGLNLGTVTGPAPKDESIIERQDPAAGTEVPVQSAVNVVVARTPRRPRKKQQGV
jgi:hypothetical protein